MLHTTNLPAVDTASNLDTRTVPFPASPTIVAVEMIVIQPAAIPMGTHDPQIVLHHRPAVEGHILRDALGVGLRGRPHGCTVAKNRDPAKNDQQSRLVNYRAMIGHRLAMWTVQHPDPCVRITLTDTRVIVNSF